MPQKLRHVAIKEFKEFVPGRNGGEIYLDGMHVQVVRFVIYGVSLYSGKVKKHTYTVLVLTNKDNLILWVSKPRYGSVHDMEILRGELPQFGKWSDITENPDTKPNQRQIWYTDKGFVGIDKLLPGIDSKQPIKKRPRQGLTESESKYNKRISRKRIKSEHAINNLKRYRRMSAAYDDNEEEFYKKLQIAAGQANLHIMWKHKKYRRLLNSL